MEARALKRSDISYLNKMLLRENKSLNVLPYEQLKDMPQEHISQFCVENGVYALPTQELISYLREEIGDKKAIEIGAGNGAIARELGIIATDSFQQQRPEMAALYHAMRQTPVNYGENVQPYEALEAVRKFKPQVVIGAYCTHKYDPREYWREGNESGIEDKKLIAKVEKYIHIGNKDVHGKKAILAVPHREFQAEWLMGRAFDKTKNVIWIWEK